MVNITNFTLNKICKMKIFLLRDMSERYFYKKPERLRFKNHLAAEQLQIVDVGESVTLAEDLGEISGLALDPTSQYLSLAIENAEVWVLKLSWRENFEESSKKASEKCPKDGNFSTKISIKEVNHFATLEGHRSVVTGLHYIGKQCDQIVELKK